MLVFDFNFFSAWFFAVDLVFRSLSTHCSCTVEFD